VYSRWRRPSRRTIAASAIFGLIVVAVSLAAPGRFGITVDSGEYLAVARSLLHGYGLTLPFGGLDEAFRTPAGSGQRVPLTQFPPLFPVLIATVAAVLHVSVYVAAVLINTCAFAWAGARLGLVVLRRSALGCVTFVAILLSLPILEPAVMVWAEPLKLAFLAESGLALSAVAQRADRRSLLRLATFALLATMTHFSGVAVGVAAVTLAANKKAAGVKPVVVALAATVVPTVGWLVYSRRAGGGLSQKALGFHPPGSLTAGLLVIASGVLLVEIRRDRTSTAVAEALFAVAFGALLVILASRTLFDRNISLDRRQLQAVVVLGIAGALVRWPAGRWATRLSAAAAGASIVAGPVVTAVAVRSVMHSEWAGYKAERWQHSPLMAAVRESAGGHWFLTNAPEAVDLLSAAQPIGLPAAVNIYTGRSNASYSSELATLRCATAGHSPLLAFFFRPTRGHARSPDPLLLTGLHAREIARFDDGIEYIVDVNGCPPVTGG